MLKSIFKYLCAGAVLALMPGLSGFAGPYDMAAVSLPGQSQNSKSVTLPLNKSTVVELPTDMMDVIVSNPAIVDAIVHTSRRVILIGKKPGQSNARFIDKSGREVLNLELRVERDLTGLDALMREHVPGAMIKAVSVNNNILLSGEVPNASASETAVSLAEMWLNEETSAEEPGKVVNIMQVLGKDQVLLKVRIVEMQRSVTKQLGIDLNAVAQLDDATVSLLSNASLGTQTGLSTGLDWTNSGGGDVRSFGGVLEALESVNLVRTLAEPTLTAISGETANFLSGGEFPIVTNVAVEDGQVVREFEFKPYGVALGFTPVVLSEGRISLSISTEVSEPTSEGGLDVGSGTDILGLRVRRANTTVELPAGGSLVIAGLIREEGRSNVDGIPGAKDIPVAGALFRNRDTSDTQTELVIMVTPYLVDPTHPDKLQTPLDTFVPTNDTEALITGRLNKVYKAPGADTNGRGLQGPLGHSVD